MEVPDFTVIAKPTGTKELKVAVTLQGRHARHAAKTLTGLTNAPLPPPKKKTKLPPRDNTKKLQVQQSVDKGDEGRPPTISIQHGPDNREPAPETANDSFKVVKIRKKRRHPITTTDSAKINHLAPHENG